MKKILHRMKGFTLLELIITLSILSILAAIATPFYLNYTRRIYFAEIVMSANPYKISVSECYRLRKTLRGCSGGSHHIPNNITTPKGSIASITTLNGMITVVPVAVHGITQADTYILTPVIVKNNLTWLISGGGVKNEYT